MKFLALPMFFLLVLSSCGKDPSPSVATTSGGQSTNPSKSDEVGTARQPQPGPARPGNLDAAFCPVVELAGHFKVAQVECNTDGKTDKPDTSALPSEYLVAAQGSDSGSLSLKIGAKAVVLVFPRNPDTWLDFQKNGTQCANGATKYLTQRCPGTNGSSCYYSLQKREGRLEALFYRANGRHVYECRSLLAAVEN